MQEGCGSLSLSHGFVMKNYLPLLQSTSLFTGIPTDQLQVLLAQLGAVVRSYGKGEALVLAGEPNQIGRAHV